MFVCPQDNMIYVISKRQFGIKDNSKVLYSAFNTY